MLLIGVGTGLPLLFIIIIFTSVLIIILLVKYRRTKQRKSKLKGTQCSKKCIETNYTEYYYQIHNAGGIIFGTHSQVNEAMCQLGACFDPQL